MRRYLANMQAYGLVDTTSLRREYNDNFQFQNCGSSGYLWCKRTSQCAAHWRNLAGRPGQLAGEQIFSWLGPSGALCRRGKLPERY